MHRTRNERTASSDAPNLTSASRARSDFYGKKMKGKKMKQYGEHVSPRGIIFLPQMFLPVFFMIALKVTLAFDRKETSEIFCATGGWVLTRGPAGLPMGATVVRFHRIIPRCQEL